MRAIGYFRETKSLSLADQSESFLEFCRKNGYEALAAFLDAKAEAEQPGFGRMVEFIKQQSAHGFLIVVVPNFLGLGGAPTECARRYFQLTSLGIPIIAMDRGEDVSTALIAIWAGQRSNGSLGERVKAAMRRKAVKGEALGRPPFGYRVGPTRRLVIVPEEGSVVRYIFRLYLKDGLGIRLISRRLNEDDLRTRRGGLWSMVTVRDILRNRAYIGTYARFGVRVPASHPPLISQEDFRRVQERLDQRRPVSVSRQMSPFLLSGLAFCGYCGNKMIGVTRKQKWQRGDGSVRTAQYRYYQCESRTNRSLCDYHTKRAEGLEEQVREALNSRVIASVARQSGNGAGSAIGIEAQIRRLRDRARRLDKRLEQHMDAAASGKISEEKLRALGNELAVEQLQLDEKLAELRRLAQHEASEGERRRQWERVLQRLRDDWLILSFVERRDLIREALERIVVKDDGLETVLRN
jgi:DNA invertase Pin-like site-specific DNA recombinase